MPQIKRKASKTEKPQKSSRTVCTIYEDETKGIVQISEDVIATIAAIAATDVEGVAYVGGNITRDKAAKASARTISRGVKVEVLDNAVTARVIIVVTYGSSIPETTLRVQEKVKSTLETMTGLTVNDVHVSVADVALESK